MYITVLLSSQFGKPSCVFREKRVLFGLVPLNLSTIRTVHLENKGEHHAYFQVTIHVCTQLVLCSACAYGI